MIHDKEDEKDEKGKKSKKKSKKEKDNSKKEDDWYYPERSKSEKKFVEEKLTIFKLINTRSEDNKIMSSSPYYNLVNIQHQKIIRFNKESKIKLIESNKRRGYFEIVPRNTDLKKSSEEEE